jgi:hypothetical protein
MTDLFITLHGRYDGDIDPRQGCCLNARGRGSAGGVQNVERLAWQFARQIGGRQTATEQSRLAPTARPHPAHVPAGQSLQRFRRSEPIWNAAASGRY